MESTTKIEQGISIPVRNLSGDAVRTLLIANAKKQLPPGTPFKLIGWITDGTPVAAWVVNPKGKRAEAKVFEELTT